MKKLAMLFIFLAGCNDPHYSVQSLRFENNISVVGERFKMVRYSTSARVPDFVVFTDTFRDFEAVYFVYGSSYILVESNHLAPAEEPLIRQHEK